MTKNRNGKKIRLKETQLLILGYLLVILVGSFLLCLPALIFPLLLPYLKLRPMLVGRAMEDLQLIYVFLSAGMVSDGTLAASLILFLALYLPFLPYRKLHNAAVVVNCYADKR